MLTLTEKAEAGNKIMNNRRDLSVGQCRELLDEALSHGKASVFDVIIKANYIGLYQGYYQHKGEVRRAQKCRKS